MYLTPKERIKEFEAKGWWKGIAVDQVFRQAVERGGEAEAIVDPLNRESLDGQKPQRLTWQEFSVRVDTVAAALLAAGVSKDDRVLAQLPNTIDAVSTFFAAARIGAIYSPVVMQYREHELLDIAKRIEPAIFITLPTFANTNHAALADRVSRAVDGCQIGMFGTVTEVDAHDLAAELTEERVERLESYLKRTKIAGGEVLTICWTSGTEARPKGVPRDHNHWVVNAHVVNEATDAVDGEIFLNPFPLVNIASIGGLVMPWIIKTGRLVLHHPFDVQVFLQQISDEGITYTIAPPALLATLLRQPQMLQSVDISSLRAIGSGSAPLPIWLIAGWRDEYGIEIANIFGSNEGVSLFSGPSSVPDPVQRASYFPRFGAAEVEWPGLLTHQLMDTRLVDPADESEITEPGKPGELRLAGAMAFSGYWNAPELNAQAFDDKGYFKTGDLFEIAGEGELARFYRFVGRSKEIIVRGGVNISPAELDDLVSAHPNIAEAATVGIPDERLGERIAAAIVSREGTAPTVAELGEWLENQGVAKFKRPEFVVQLDALPRNAMNKVVRDDLRDILLERLD